MLGGLPNVKYKNNEATLEVGQVLFLYTDGVTEANNEEGQLFSDPRLIKFLKTVADKSVQDICNAVVDEVDNFAGNAEQFDDITAVALQYKPQQK